MTISRASCDTADGFTGQAEDGIAQAVNDFVEGLEHFIMEASGSKFFPNLLNRIHFLCMEE